ncbi:MAG: hypothetical protein KatS3mg031_1689 [Chitinophagales bacterium]|nr:MAG: hypothetical protein KatS3mg031_1689 [Chitinophagales bacterium]
MNQLRWLLMILFLAGTTYTAKSVGSNDDCLDAIVINPGQNIPFDNRGANTDGGGSLPACAGGGNDTIFSDVWYAFTPNCDGTAMFTTVGGTLFDTKIAVYTAPCPGIIIACNDDTTGGILQSSVTWSVTAGTTYLLRLGVLNQANEDTGTFDLYLFEPIPPVISCSADITVNTDAGQCSALVSPPLPSASDNCVTFTLSNSFNGTADATDVYPQGITILTWTVSDVSNNTATCSHTITVNDIESPVITCPANITQPNDAGMCGANVAIPAPATSDNCGILSIVNNFNGTANASDFYPVGTTLVGWTITDLSGNTASCSHTVTITDTENPVITCPADIVIPVCDSSIIIPLPATGDNCGVASLINDFNGTSNASGTYPVGTTAVNWTVTDAAGNSSGCVMQVTRNVPPTVVITPLSPEVCAANDITLQGNPVAGSSAILAHQWNGVALVSSVNNSSVVFNMGIAGNFGPLVYSVTDDNGCQASDSVWVTVYANPQAAITPDVIELCESDSRLMNGNPSGGNPPYITHLWTGANSFLSDNSMVNPVFHATSSGSYQLTYTVTDSKNCQASDVVTVVVNENPSVNITPDPATVCQQNSLTLDANLSAGTGNVVAAQWTGDVGPLSSVISPTPVFHTSVPGAYNLIFTATDDNNCRASDTALVTVNPLPVVTFAGLDATQCANNQPDTLTGTPSGGIFSGPGIGGFPVEVTYTDTFKNIFSNVSNVFNLPVNLSSVSALGSDVILKRACFSVNHPHISELTFILESPGGATVTLAANLCGLLADMDVCITPGTANSIELAPCSATPPALSGVYNAMLGFDLDDLNDGSSPNGVWKLTIADNQFMEDGLLLSWSLEFEIPGILAFNPAAAGPGNHVITYTFTDVNGCVNYQTQTAVVYPLPSVHAGPDMETCEGKPALLNATGADSYQWSTGDAIAMVQVTPMVTNTYSVTGTNTFGCAQSDEVTVMVNPLPIVTLSGLSTTYCENDQADTLRGSPPGGIMSGPGIQTFGMGPSSFSATGVPLYIPSDTIVTSGLSVSGLMGQLGMDVILQSVCFQIAHTYVSDLDIVLESPSGAQVVLASMPCTSEDDLNVCIIPGSGNSMDDALCNIVAPALSGTFTASSTIGDDLNVLNDGVTSPNGTWKLLISDNFTGDDGSLITWSLNFYSYGYTMFNPSLAGGGTRTILYEYTDGNGCWAADTLQTTVLPAPAALALPDTAVCLGEAVTLVAAGGVSYSWSTGSTDSGIVVTPAVTTVYTVTVTNADGCTATDDVTVTVLPLPPADAGNDQTVCPSASTVLTASGGIAYSWSTGEQTAFIQVSPSDSTTYHVTVTDLNGCSASDSVTVNIYPQPVVIPGPDEEICRGDSVIITASGGIQYSWSDGVITTGTGSRPASPLATTLYQLTASDVNGCTATGAVLVTVHNIPQVMMTGLDISYCDDNLPDTLTGFPAGGVFSGPGITGNVFMPASLTPGQYTILYTYTDTFGCSATDSNTTNIFPAPNVSFAGLQPEYCPDTVAHVLIGNPSGGIFSGPGISGNTFVSYYAGPGVHTITYTIRTQLGCSSFKSQTVTVHVPPMVSIMGLDPYYCEESQPDTLSGMPSGGIFIGNEMQGNVFVPPLVDYASPAVIHYFYMDSNGCTGSVSAVRMVYPTPQPVIINPGNICINQPSVQLHAAPSGGTFTGDGFSGNLLYPIQAGLGSHSVTYTYTDSRGCTGDTTIQIMIYDAPSASLVDLAPEYCFNEPLVVLQGNPAGGRFSGPGVSGNTFAPPLAGAGGPYPIVYTYVGANGCVGTDTQMVTVLNKPFIFISGLSPQYCLEDQPSAINALPAGGTWSGPGISNDSFFNPKVAGLGTHVLAYEVTSMNGCSEVKTVQVRVESCTGITGTESPSVRVYPNPTSGWFRMEISAMKRPDVTLKVYDITGRLMVQKRLLLPDVSVDVDLTGFPAGSYFIQLITSSGNITAKIIVQ